QLDLKALPQQIEKLEQQQAALTEKMSEPDFYQQAADKITEAQQQLATLEAELEATFDKWAALEAKQNQ
ncbi:MAG TPA: ABC transporter ATP-binding protein, partial [Methylotenera sp.]|nr:ABC transporter ATP-binding protein [Methylotenera sp.]